MYKFIQNTSLSEVFEREFIQKIQDTFAKAMLVSFSILDHEDYFIEPSNMNDYCKLITSTPEGKKRCINCYNKNGCTTSEKGGISKFKCHAGLYSIAMPLIVLGSHLGTICAGSVLFKEIDNDKTYIDLGKELGISENDLRKSLKDITIIDEKRFNEITSSFMLMTNISEMAYKNVRLLRERKKGNIIRQISKLINNSNSKEQVLSEICCHVADLFDVQRVIIIKQNENFISIEKDYKISDDIKVIENIVNKTQYNSVMGVVKEFLFLTDYINAYENIDSLNLPVYIKDLLKETGLKSGISATITSDDSVKVMILLQDYTTERHWEQREIEFLGLISEMIDATFQREKLINNLTTQAKREQTILDNIPYEIWLKDKSGKYLTVNKKYLEVESLKLEDVVGHTDFELYGYDLAKERTKEDLSIITSGQPVQIQKLTQIANSHRWVETFKAPILDKNGTAYAVAGILRDITTEKEIDKIKSEFISMVSHELRTPLTSIIGSLELVLAGATGELSTKTNDLLKIANTNSQRLLNLINDILDVEKMEAGKVAFKMNKYNILSIIQKVICEIEPFANKYGINIENTSCDDVFVNIDEIRFIQVLTNILSNAIKFSAKESPVQIFTSTENNNIIISVVNYGVTIPKEFANSIFKKFSQIDSSDRRKKGGTGLGLNIAKSFVEHFGGEIWFESNDDKTTFFVKLPIAEE